jgi:hypothetical protein
VQYDRRIEVAASGPHEEALQRMLEVEKVVMAEVRDGEMGDVLESLQLSLLVLFSDAMTSYAMTSGSEPLRS